MEFCLNTDDLLYYCEKNLSYCRSSLFLVVDPSQLLASMSRLYNMEKRRSVNNEEIVRSLKSMKVYSADQNKKMMAIFVHGPHSQKELDMYNVVNAMDGCSNVVNNHWSLLVHLKEPGIFYHFDSLLGLNDSVATDTVNFLVDYGIVNYTDRVTSTPLYFPQQISDWECGYYSLLALSMITKTTPFSIQPIRKHHMEHCKGDKVDPFFSLQNCKNMMRNFFRKEIT